MEFGMNGGKNRLVKIIIDSFWTIIKETDEKKPASQRVYDAAEMLLYSLFTSAVSLSMILLIKCF